MLPVNCGSHADYQNFVVENPRKYYPDPDALARSTRDIIERFWNLDLSFTDTSYLLHYLTPFSYHQLISIIFIAIMAFLLMLCYFLSFSPLPIQPQVE